MKRYRISDPRMFRSMCTFHEFELQMLARLVGKDVSHLSRAQNGLATLSKEDVQLISKVLRLPQSTFFELVEEKKRSE